jgi:transposase-like protein
MNDLKKVYQASSKEIAENYLLELEEKWGEKYLLVVKPWQNNWENLSGYFKLQLWIRKKRKKARKLINSKLFLFNVGGYP